MSTLISEIAMEGESRCTVGELQTLFYIWDKLGRQIPGYFSFKASRYGPYPADIYSSFGDLSKQNLVVMPPSFPGCGTCYLTDKGKAAADKITQSVESNTLALIEQVTCEIAALGASQLLHKWQSEAPEFANPPLASPEIRQKATEILRSGRQNALGEVEKLLEWQRDIGMPMDTMACQLGITSSHLKYLLQREYLRKREKKEKTARKEAALTPGSVIISEKLRFSIWLPDGWQVGSEDDNLQDVTERAQFMYDLWRESLDGKNLEKRYHASREVLKDAIVPFDEFVRIENREAEIKEQQWQRKLALNKKEGLQVGHWCASPEEKRAQDPISAEVTKFRFREPMTSLEMYYAEKPEQEHLVGNQRPPAFTVDGVEAVRAYYRWRSGNRYGEQQFATYIADGLTGWIIECWSIANDAFLPKPRMPLFYRIVSSFHRI